jgi:beta-mannosidase
MGVHKILLSEGWKIKNPEKGIDLPTSIPSTVFETLLAHKKIPDPFYGRQEHDVDWVYNSDWTYECLFSIPKEIASAKHILLRCYGLDLKADLLLNGQPIGSANNAHRTYEFLIDSIVKEKENFLQIQFYSSPKQALQEIEQYGQKLFKADFALAGVPYLRKAQYSFGWDWGPKLPDHGIWRPIEIIAYDEVLIESVFPKQKFYYEENQIKSVELDIGIEVRAELSNLPTLGYNIAISIHDPSKRQVIAEITAPLIQLKSNLSVTIPNPKLWWSHDIGDPFLYVIKVDIRAKSDISHIIDSKSMNLGIRDLKLIQKPDRWGQTFYFELNGIPVFGKGADWIPVDNFIPRGKKLGLHESNLISAKNANMNMIRIWGGGIYEEDLFYDLCDEMGILLWQDFTFACAIPPPLRSLHENFKCEAIDNIIRLRSHPSLAIWCGNNEIEQLFSVYVMKVKGIKAKKEFRAGYRYLFEELLPQLTKEYDGTRTYWPSSPSNGKMAYGLKGLLSALDANSPNKGDSHYWMVWHGGFPFKAYRRFNSRFMSEFGFESFPSMRTIETFSTPSDYNFLSPVMENHQKNLAGNNKIMSYMKKRFIIPKTFEQQVMLSQLTQAEAVEYGVEHWRRNRNDFHCMGAIYWQLNDCWPVASWASLDYYGRWKALHYFAKRFYNPLFPSVSESDKTVEFWLTNDLPIPVQGEYCWKIYSISGQLVKENKIKVQINPTRSELLETLRLSSIGIQKTYFSNYIIHFEFTPTTTSLVGSTDFETRFGFRLLTDPKHLRLEPADITLNSKIIQEKNPDESYLEVNVVANNSVLFLYFESDRVDFIASDMFFAMYPGQQRAIKLKIQQIHNQKVENILEALKRLQSSLLIKSLADLR